MSRAPSTNQCKLAQAHACCMEHTSEKIVWCSSRDPPELLSKFVLSICTLELLKTRVKGVPVMPVNTERVMRMLTSTNCSTPRGPPRLSGLKVAPAQVWGAHVFQGEVLQMDLPPGT